MTNLSISPGEILAALMQLYVSHSCSNYDQYFYLRHFADNLAQFMTSLRQENFCQNVFEVLPPVLIVTDGFQFNTYRLVCYKQSEY